MKTDREMRRERAFAETIDEVLRVDGIWPDYNSAHEALGVITEEFEEFKDLVKMKQKDRASYDMRKELIQLASTAIRAAAVCDVDWVLK